MRLFVFRDNQQFGPYSTEELRAFYANGQVQLDEPCRLEQDGATEWTTVGKLLGIAKPPPPPRGQASGPDQSIYDRVAAELQAKQLHDGLWAQAVAESGGDMDQARALYTHLRAAALHAASIKRSRATLAYVAAGIAVVVVIAILFPVFHTRSPDERTANNSVDDSSLAPPATPQVLPKNIPSANAERGKWGSGDNS
jgi:hypothetical protein